MNDYSKDYASADAQKPPEPPETDQPVAVSPDDKQAHTWAMFCHLSSLAGYLGIPFGHILGPLIVWLVKKDEYPLVDEHGKRALNFNVSMCIYGIVAAILIVVFVGIILLAALAVTHLVCTIIAAVKVSNNEPFSYPLTIEFFK